MIATVKKNGKKGYPRYAPCSEPGEEMWNVELVYPDGRIKKTDYFDVGHYVSIHIGKWDKPFSVTQSCESVAAIPKVEGSVSQ